MKYSFKARKDGVGDAEVIIDAASKSQAKEKIKQVLHVSWRIINATCLTPEGDQNGGSSCTQAEG